MNEGLEPVEEADIEVDVSCAEDIKNLCETKAMISQRVIDYTVTGEGIKAAEIRKESNFQVSFKPSATKLYRRAPQVACDLKSLRTESIVKCEVNQIEVGKYAIRYIPTVQGPHELVLTVNKRVLGSPFPLLVSISPTQLGEPVKPPIDIKEYAQSMAVNDMANEIIVASASANVSVFDWNGKLL